MSIPFLTPAPLPVKVTNVADITIGVVKNEGTSDGGTTWVPESVDASGNQNVNVVSTAQMGTPVNGIGNYAAAQSDVELIADPGVGKAIHITALSITNDATLAITVKLEADTASAKTAITPTYKIPASGTLNLSFGAQGIVATAHKNVGVVTTGTSNFTVHAVGYAV